MRPAPVVREIFVSPAGVRWVVTHAGDPKLSRRARQAKLSRLDGAGQVEMKLIAVAWLLSRYTRGGMLEADRPTMGPAPRRMTPARLRAWNLRRLRTFHGWTLREMSRETGVGRTFLTEMERNARAITIKTIDRIAAGLGLAPSKVLAELDAPPPSNPETLR